MQICEVRLHTQERKRSAISASSKSFSCTHERAYSIALALNDPMVLELQQGSFSNFMQTKIFGKIMIII
jgi:hypothetical protein